MGKNTNDLRKSLIKITLKKILTSYRSFDIIHDRQKIYFVPSQFEKIFRLPHLNEPSCILNLLSSKKRTKNKKLN